ncbi:hypothetical protein RRG08_030107 [Elysia crispata]|uniref:Uncharacterized protein n=1 Tax=Elysia crispata TaxID=231223 RepID=A0AAE0ZRB8_9GAST|nr:hypothetical protein RRG08_030107 [Elysia crispata]
MADTLFFKRSQTMYPYYVNMPPTVPRYPASQDMFRREEPEKYTQRKGRAGYQNWTDKWYDWEHPVRRQEELPQIADRHEPLSRPWEYGVHMGVVAQPKWTREGKDWPINNKKYLRSGIPNTENHRARAIREMSFKDEKLYPFSNYMTSTYRRPVYSVFGPMQKDPVFGLTRQRSRHGHMPFEDYY